MPQLITPDSMRAAARPQGTQIVDVGRNPELKAAMLAGRLQLIAPFIYHDPSKEIAFVLMPLELNLRDMDQQRIIGQFTQTIMRNLPPDAPRGYLLQPRTFFTFQSMVEAILEKDGITPEMLRAQEERANLIREFMRSTDETSLRDAIRQSDAKIDAEFFDLLSASIEANIAGGREQGAQQLSGLQAVLIQESTFGRRIGKRLEAMDAFQKTPTRDNLIEQLIKAPDPETKETLVAMGRQMLDYAFFQNLSQRIDAAAPADSGALKALRKEIQDIRDKLDTAQRDFVEQKARLVETILGSSDPMETARENEAQIDETFIALVQANAQQAQQKGDQELFRAMQTVYQVAMQIVAERQPPEVQFINALLSAKTDDEQRQLLKDIAANGADDRLIRVMGQLADQLAQEDRTDTAGKLTQLMVLAREILPKYAGPAPDRPQTEAPADESPRGGGLIGPDGLIRGSNEPPPAAPKIEIARR